MANRTNTLILGFLLLVFGQLDLQGADSLQERLTKINLSRGIVAVIGPENDAMGIIDFAKGSELTLYYQSDNPQQVNTLRQAALESGLLGTRIFAEVGTSGTIHLGDNIADAILVNADVEENTIKAELLRVLRPQGVAHLGSQQLIKPIPAGIDEWTHPYHGPDNNPQSNDQLVKGRLRTQFLGYPKFSPMPEQSVIAGGRIYKAMGHISHKANQNEMLNTLLCINAYNGTILWKRPTPPGFMIHRNTMVATADALYLGDDQSCKIIDGQTGEVRDEITFENDISDGPVWKWMAIQDGVLYALVGSTEIRVDTQASTRRGLGHWPWGMWQGHDYKDPKLAFGFGRTLVAIDLKTRKTLWHHRDEDFLDARATCMSDGRIFCYSPEKFVLCLDAKTGETLWKNSDPELLKAIGPNGRAQHYITGYATACYMKCRQDYLFFAGPQRERMVVASAKNGKLAWTYPLGNLQLVLREDAIWAAGPQDAENGVRLDYNTGKVLATFPARRACTRATGCADSIFFRANGGTVRVLTETNTAQHIDPMRPPCQDGVLISNGHLYWGPWMCGCQLSLYGNIGLSPTTDALPAGSELYADALVTYAHTGKLKPLAIDANDWASYRGNNARTDVTNARIADELGLLWEADLNSNTLPTAPVVAGGMVFVADRSGTLRAWDENGKIVWQAFAGGPVYYPPAVAHDRVYVGSADGRVYTYAAKTGQLLWSFRVAPKDYRIPVYGSLISAWPIAGGVVVQDDTLYAVAGITHYDGTYVVALDAVTGKLKASNSSSGVLESQVNNGISLQGELSIVDGELRFLAGGVYETARYDLSTLKCLNEPKSQVSSQFRTAFYPYYPEYGNYVSLDHTCANGCLLNHDASYEGSVFTNLALHEPLPPGETKPYKEAARWIARRGGNAPKVLWQDQANRRFNGFAVSQDRLIAAGHVDSQTNEAFLAAIMIKEGTDQWLKRLPANAVKGGVAVDHHGRVYVSLENGQLLCFGRAE